MSNSWAERQWTQSKNSYDMETENSEKDKWSFKILIKSSLCLDAIVLGIVWTAYLRGKK